MVNEKLSKLVLAKQNTMEPGKPTHKGLEAGYQRPQPLENPWAPAQLAKTLWLFTESDFATFVGPDTLFGIAAALSGPLLTSNESPHLLTILGRIPAVILWNWANLLIFDLANQRSPASVDEDIINKPWRPIPQGRITSEQTRRMLLVSLPAVLLVNYFLGAWQETVILFALTWMYNDLGGGDDGFLIRNVIIAGAFSQYNKGAMRVAAAQDFEISTKAFNWLLITSGVIGTTMHYQDMKDQDGDRMRGRRTAPLILGDGPTRLTLAIPTAVWSLVCPAYWNNGLVGYASCVSLGAVIIFRILTMRGYESDKRTWWIWTAWTGVIWLQPVFADYSIFTRFGHEVMGALG